VSGATGTVSHSTRAVGLRCVYTDLDGTLLEAGASLFRDGQGNYTLLPARALEACHRAEVARVGRPTNSLNEGGLSCHLRQQARGRGPWRGTMSLPSMGLTTS